MSNTHGPIQPELQQTMQALALGLNEILSPWGFVLLCFPMNEPVGRMNYISNGRREDIIVALRELVANFEGRGHSAPEARQ